VVVELEVLTPKQVLDVLQIPGDEVVHGNDMVAFGQKPLAQVRTKETGAAGDKNSFFRGHIFLAAGCKLQAASF
jgi:hypothetical protein